MTASSYKCFKSTLYRTDKSLYVSTNFQPLKSFFSIFQFFCSCKKCCERCTCFANGLVGTEACKCSGCQSNNGGRQEVMMMTSWPFKVLDDLIPLPHWFFLNNLETVKTITLAFCSIQKHFIGTISAKFGIPSSSQSPDAAQNSGGCVSDLSGFLVNTF